MTSGPGLRSSSGPTTGLSGDDDAACLHTDDLKLTNNQNLVLSVLQLSGHPLSAYTILDRLRDDGLKATLQVYRALEKLLEAGRIHRLESMNAFVACCHSKHRQIHPRIIAFEICEPCGKVNEYHDTGIRGPYLPRSCLSRLRSFSISWPRASFEDLCGSSFLNRSSASA